MVDTLVATKLFVPRLRAGAVERLRLRERLNLGAEARLTLVSAPAGFGKTTLLAEWIATAPPAGGAVAWLSLDKADNDPAAFWPHVISALETAAPGAGAPALDVLTAGQQPIEAALSALVNALVAMADPVWLVLDDYHVIDDPAIEAGMAFLLDHLPPQIHLVVSTRADPALPLARLRARGELVEVRSADLRFSAAETATYLNDRMGLAIQPNDVDVLGGRTEGWIAAIQLAALSMQGRADPAAFIAGFAGNDRYIVDYLVEEVLQRQPPAVRAFLLRTCFLARLNGGLCDAVTGGTSGRSMLEALERENLFVVPLDDRREWYRYHHLFADVLQSHFADELCAELPLLHRRASDWYDARGERYEAIEHAFAGSDFERAAALIEGAIPDMHKNRGEAILRRWAHALPRDVVRSRPVLGIGLIGGLISFGDFADIESRLTDVEEGLAALANGGDAGVIVVDQLQLPRVPGAVELYRAALAQVRGDVPGLIVHAQRVLELAPPDDHVGRAAGSSMLGIAYWSQGQLEAAREAWSVGRNGLQRSGHIADTLGVSIAIADILLAQGRLREATETYEQALQLASAQGGPVLRGTADMYAGLSELCRERNDRVAAHRHLAQSRELGESAGLPQHPYRWRVAAAHLMRDEGDLDGAATLMEEAERLYVSDFFPPVRPVSAMRARLAIEQGRLDDAVRWQREHAVVTGDALTYLREFEHITLARLLLAQKSGDAVGFLDHLLADATKGERLYSVIEISLLQVLAAGGHDPAAALVPLTRALTLAEPEGFAGLFVEGGERMAALLRGALKRGITPAYTRRLTEAFGAPAQTAAQSHPELIEPLSDRELDVLRLLRTDLGGPEIARELMISLNTMRTHTKNLYEKLSVTSRRSAVHRAEELSLFGRNPQR